MKGFLKHQTLIGLGICFVGVMLWLSPWWAGGKNLAPLNLLHQMMEPWRSGETAVTVENHIVSDAVDQYLVYRMVAAESYAKEGWVGWSSLTYGGTAQYANTMALYFDWTMQLHRWFEFWTAWHLGFAAQLFLAAAGMFLFLRGRAIGLLWAVCGALLYAGNSQFITWIYHRWALGSFCWVPWILWAIDGYRKGQRGFQILIPLFIGMGFLGGTLQHAALVMLAVIAMWMESAISGGKNFPLQARLLGRYAVWGVLGAGVSAMMLVPCIDAFLTSSKLGIHAGMHGSAEMGVYPHGWLQPLYNLVAYPLQIFPSLSGRSGSLDLMKLFKSELFYVAYFGSLPVLVAFLALFWKKMPVLARVLVMMGLLLPLTPLVRFLYQRLFLLFILGGIFAFAHFMQTAEAKVRERIFKIAGRVTALVVVAWTAVSIGLHFKGEKLDEALRGKLQAAGSGSSFGYFQDWMNVRIDRFFAELLIWSPQQAIPLFLWVLALFGLRVTASSAAKRRALGSAMVVGAVLMEVTVFGSRWVVWSDPALEPLFPETAETEVLRKEVGENGRVACLNHPTGHMAMTPFIPNTLSAYGVATSYGYDSIVPNGMNVAASTTWEALTLGRLGVSHLITFPGNAEVPDGWEKLWESDSMVLYENPAVVPRYAGFGSAEELDEMLQGRGGVSVQSLNESRGLENSREIEVMPGLKWIRVAENHADGWKYRVNREDSWKSATRALDGSMLLDLTGDGAAISRSVEMVYDPPLRRAGFIMSGVSLLLVLAFGFGELPSTRPRKPTAEIPSLS